MKKTKKKVVWKPPPGFVAIQTYVLKEVRDEIGKLAKDHERSLRAELRIIITEYARSLLATHRTSFTK